MRSTSRWKVNNMLANWEGNSLLDVLGDALPLGRRVGVFCWHLVLFWCPAPGRCVAHFWGLFSFSGSSVLEDQYLGRNLKGGSGGPCGY
eukprot:6408679-Amphidinium_carterae.2